MRLRTSIRRLFSTSAVNKMTDNIANKPYTIVVEGNIGAGKTTFLQKFSGCPGVSVLSEPVDKWRDIKGHNLLQRMYENPAGNSFLLQSYIQLTMLQQHLNNISNNNRRSAVNLMERSLLSARYCFVENLYSKGLMNDAEYSVISEWFNFIVTCPQFADAFKPDLIIYLQTDPEVAFRRVQNRNRKEETSKIKLEYIEDLHELHEDWLVRKVKFQPLPAKVITVKANAELDELESEYARVKDKILDKAAASNNRMNL